MTQIYESMEKLFEGFSEFLDLSPTQLNRAFSISTNLSKWISDREYSDGAVIKVYTQGSMRLGTTVRPYKKDKEKEYDVDIVAEIINPNSVQKDSPHAVKFLVRDRIVESEIYKKKLIGKESKLCWKLIFEPEMTADGEVGFHIDVLPAISKDGSNLSILHPVKEEADKYYWKCSNPQKFAEWFDSLNEFSGKKKYYEQYREKVFSILSENYEENSTMMNFREAKEIPNTFVRTPLQRSVQLLKRNRDIFTANSKMKIDSIIITRLAAGLYHGELSIYQAFANIIKRLLKYKRLVEDINYSMLKESNNFLEKDLITREYDVEQGAFIWVIENPCNSEENYAFRWHEDENAQAKYFFQWLENLESLLLTLDLCDLSNVGPKVLEPMFGENASRDFFKDYGDRIRHLREQKILKDSSEGLSNSTGNTVEKHNFWGS
jgi:hypothetical protein